MRSAATLAALLFASQAAAVDLNSAPVELREIELTYSAEAVIEAVRQSTVSSGFAQTLPAIPF